MLFQIQDSLLKNHFSPNIVYAKYNALTLKWFSLDEKSAHVVVWLYVICLI